MLGKYLAALAIYTVALLFSLSHVVVLCWLGSPDPGLIISTYLGYWLMGAALLTLGMLASALTANLTVAFILGALFCSVPVFLDYAGAIVSGAPQRLAEKLSVVEQFRDLSNGVITLGPLAYFVSFALAVLYLNVILLGQRRWLTGPKSPWMRGHLFARALALAVIVGSLTLLASNSTPAHRCHLRADPFSLPRNQDPAALAQPAPARLHTGILQPRRAAQLRGSPRRPGRHVARI